MIIRNSLTSQQRVKRSLTLAFQCLEIVFWTCWHCIRSTDKNYRWLKIWFFFNQH